MKQLVLILPAFNEATVIAKVLKQIQVVVKKLPVKTEILVVNDGSSDNTKAVLNKMPIKLVSHKINRGLGASLGTGLKYAKIKQADFAITMDSDGQHDPHDIVTILQPLLKNQADVVIGSRMLGNKKDMPILRRLNNKAFNLLTLALFGITTTDSLSGFRGFSKKAIQNLELKTERMEVSNEFFTEIKRHDLKFAEVPIKVIYTQYSMAKGVQPSNIFAIIFRLVLRLFR
ncbi:glycosyltransferase family 2 protein [Patescibacteria group bacterium]